MPRVEVFPFLAVCMLLAPFACESDRAGVATHGNSPRGEDDSSVGDGGSESPSPTSTTGGDSLEPEGSRRVPSDQASPDVASAPVPSSSGSAGSNPSPTGRLAGGGQGGERNTATDPAPQGGRDAGTSGATSTSVDASGGGGGAPVEVQPRGSLDAEQEAALIAGTRAEWCAGYDARGLVPSLAYKTRGAPWVECANAALDCNALLDCPLPAIDPPGNGCIEPDGQTRNEPYCQGSVVLDCGVTDYSYDCAEFELECAPVIPSGCVADPPDCTARGRSCVGNVLSECNGFGLALEVDCADIFGALCVESAEQAARCAVP